jgi:hypothetical protein
VRLSVAPNQSAPAVARRGPIARAIVCVACVAMAMLAGACDDPACARCTASGRSVREANAESAISAARYFSVLHATRTLDDELPPAGRALLVGSTRLVFPVGAAGYARRLFGGQPAWLVPAADGVICIMDEVFAVARASGGRSLPPQPGLTCAYIDEAKAGRLVVTHSGSPAAHGKSLVMGVAPDGVRAVIITSGDGHKTTVPVMRNGYVGLVNWPVQGAFVTCASCGKARRTTFAIAALAQPSSVRAARHSG